MKNQSKSRTDSTRFQYGEIKVQRSVLSVVSEFEVDDFLERHLSGDWGLVEPIDELLNDRALRNGEDIFSVFRSESRELCLVVTDGNRDTTYVALKDDPIWDDRLDKSQHSKAAQ